MTLPKSVVKLKKDHIEYTSNVERTKYLLSELTRAALRDVGKFITKRTRQVYQTRLKKHSGRLAKNIQYWVRKRDADLQIGYKPGGFYGGFFELGTSQHPKVGAMQETVMNNINEIRDIQGKYLSAIEEEQKALRLIDEREEISDD